MVEAIATGKVERGLSVPVAEVAVSAPFQNQLIAQFDPDLGLNEAQGGAAKLRFKNQTKRRTLWSAVEPSML